jgi:hypothetical protein
MIISFYVSFKLLSRLADISLYWVNMCLTIWRVSSFSQVPMHATTVDHVVLTICEMCANASSWMLWLSGIGTFTRPYRVVQKTIFCCHLPERAIDPTEERWTEQMCYFNLPGLGSKPRREFLNKISSLQENMRLKKILRLVNLGRSLV